MRDKLEILCFHQCRGLEGLGEGKDKKKTKSAMQESWVSG